MAQNSRTTKTPVMAVPGVRYPEAVLGIDIGSTETRVVLAWRDGAKIRTRVIENRFDARSSLNGPTHFVSRVLTNDANALRYIGNSNQSFRGESSAKFLPYILVAEREKLREQYPILERLWEERGRVGKSIFHARLEHAFSQLLLFVLNATKRVIYKYWCDEEPILIKTVAMTIPSQWDLDIKGLYRRLFMRAFWEVFVDTPLTIVHDIAMVFPTEATALAQYIFHECSHDVGLGGGMPDIRTILGKPNAQCLIDCGGHNANSTLTRMHRNKDGKAVLYELGKPRGAGGGTELWIQDLLDQLVDQYRRKYRDQGEITPGFYQALKRRTIASLEIMTEQASELICCPGPRNNTIVLEVTTEMCERASQAGFKHVKPMVESQLQKLASIKQGWGAIDHIITIIVSGGSALHPDFRKWIEALCVKLNLPGPLSTKNMELHYEPARIALGAAYASLDSESVSSFAEKCAFGLQKCKVMNHGKDDEHLRLGNAADTIWYHERGIVPVTFDAEGDQTEFQIVCQPYLESFTEKLYTDQDMATGESYDFLNIGTLSGGYSNRIEFNLDVENEEVELKVFFMSLSCTSARDGPKRKAASQGRVLSFGPFPVHVQPGTCFMVIKQSTAETNQRIEAVMESYSDDAYKDDIDYDDTYSVHAHQGSASSLVHANPAPQNSASDLTVSQTTANMNKIPATNESSSNSKASSARSVIASKADTARATNLAFGYSRDVSGKVTSSSQKEPGELLRKTTISDSQPDQAMGHSHNTNASYIGEASYSRHVASSSKARETQSSASASRKRPAPPEAEIGGPKKRTHTTDGSSSGVLATPGQNASPGGPGRYRGTASSARQSEAASEAGPISLTKRDRIDDRPAARTVPYLSLNAPSRNLDGAQDFTFSDRHRQDVPDATPRPTARRNPGNNVLLSGSAHTPMAIAPPGPSHDGTVPPRASQVGNTTSGSLSVGSPRPNSSVPDARTSGTAHGSKQPRDFNGFGPAHRSPAIGRRPPPRSD